MWAIATGTRDISKDSQGPSVAGSRSETVGPLLLNQTVSGPSLRHIRNQTLTLTKEMDEAQEVQRNLSRIRHGHPILKRKLLAPWNSDGHHRYPHNQGKSQSEAGSAYEPPSAPKARN